MRASMRIGQFFGFQKSSRRREAERLGRVRERVSALRPLARRQVVIALVCGANLVFLPWAFAGASLGAQIVALVLGATAFAFLFLPVGYDERRSAMASDSFRALIRCVPFWTGLLLLSLFLIQGLNPGYKLVFAGSGWLVVPHSAIKWLPTGVEAPFSRETSPMGMNAFRLILMFSGPWLTFCALWCGVFSRRLALRLAGAVSLSAAVLSVFAVAMRATGKSAPLGYAPPEAVSTFGSFFYQNQAGAFFSLVAAVGFSAVIAYWSLAETGGRRGGPHQPLLVTSLLAAAAALASFSFGAVLGVVVILPVAVWAALRERARSTHFSGSGTATQALAISLLLVLAVGAVASFGDFHGLSEKISAKFHLIRTDAIDDRAPIRAATLRMYEDASPAYGAGAGSYRWLSPTYFAQDPVFCDANGFLRVAATHAHCDWLQMLAEWGIVGLSLVSVSVFWVFYQFRRIGRAPYAWPAFVGLLVLFAHAGADCLLFNPAVGLVAAFTVYLVRSLIHAANA